MQNKSIVSKIQKTGANNKNVESDSLTFSSFEVPICSINLLGSNFMPANFVYILFILSAELNS